MSYTIVTLPAMKIVGMANKTTNDHEQSAHDLPKLWSNYFTQEIETTIPHKKEPLQRICLYTDYKPQGYTVIIGACVTVLEDVPATLEERELPAGKYAVFTVNGPLETAVAKAWHHIRAIADLPRAFTNDFELYEYNDNGDNLRSAKIFVSLI